jgi:hypothetical protein
MILVMRVASFFFLRGLALALLFPILASSRTILRPAPEDQIILDSHATAGDPRSLRFAVLGDSWASGINFGPPSAESVLLSSALFCII